MCVKSNTGLKEEAEKEALDTEKLSNNLCNDSFCEAFVRRLCMERDRVHRDGGDAMDGEDE